MRHCLHLLMKKNHCIHTLWKHQYCWKYPYLTALQYPALKCNMYRALDNYFIQVKTVCESGSSICICGQNTYFLVEQFFLLGRHDITAADYIGLYLWPCWVFWSNVFVLHYTAILNCTITQPDMVRSVFGRIQTITALRSDKISCSMYRSLCCFDSWFHIV